MGQFDADKYRLTSSTEGGFATGTVHVQAYDRKSGSMVGRLEGTPGQHYPRQGLERYDSPVFTESQAYPSRHDGVVAQGELFNNYPGKADMLAVKGHHQGNGLARAMANVLGNRVGNQRPSDHLTPDSAGMLDHMGVSHADPQVMLRGEDGMSARDTRNTWASASVNDRNLELKNSARGSRTERDESHLGNVTPSFMGGGDTRQHMTSPQFAGHIPGQQQLPGM